MPSIFSFALLLFSFYFLFSGPCSAKVWINEFSPSSDPEWIEIYNDSDEEINLTQWRLVDNNSNTGDDIDLDGCIKPNSYRSFSPSSKYWLNNDGDIIYLENPEGDTEDQVAYGKEGDISVPKEDESARRSPDGSDNWLVNAETSKEDESCSLPADTHTPTQKPTSTPTNSPTPIPTEKPESNVPEISITNISDNIKVGVMFYVDCKVDGFEPNQEYYLKVVIGETPDGKYIARTLSEDRSEWLSFNSSWNEFPRLKTNDQGTIEGVKTIRAKVKEGSLSGKYYLKVLAHKVADEGSDNINSSEQEIDVDPAPTPTPTKKNTPTPNPTKKPSLTPTPSDKISPTATLTPSPSDSQTPTPTKSDRDWVNKIFKQNNEDEGEVLGESTQLKERNKNKLISLSFIGIGGGCISVVGFWPYLKKIFATIKKDEE